MFWHLFRYKLRYMRSDWVGTFWLVIFPIAMAFLFRLSFPSQMLGQLETIPVAIVSTDATLEDAMNESGLFEISHVDEAEAIRMLEDEKIKGYVAKTDDGISFRAGKTGMSTTILKSFLDIYLQRTAAVVTIFKADGTLDQTMVFERLSDDTQYVTEGSLGDKTNTMLIFYYGLMGMAIAMAMTNAVDNIKFVQANQSAPGMRMNLAPVPKLTAFAASTAATVLAQFASVLLLLALLRFGFGYDLGGHTLVLLGFCFVGCVASLAFGSLICALLPGGDGVKNGLLIGITMIGTTCSGMMSPQLRYLVYSKFPAIGYISLPNIISDGFYTLYFYDSVPRVLDKMLILAGFSVVGMLGTALVLRRQSYKSI